MSSDSARLTSTLARGTGINLFGFLFRTAFVFLHSVLTAQLFGAAIYGQYAVALAGVMLLSSVTEIGLARTLIRFVAAELASENKGRVRELLWLSLKITVPVALVMALVMVIWVEPVANLFGDQALETALPIFALALPVLTLMTILSSYTQGFARMRYKTLALDFIRPGVELLAVVTFAFFGYTNSAVPLAIAYAISIAVAAIALIYYIATSLMPAASPDMLQEDPPLTASVLRFTLPVWLMDLLSSAATRSSFLLLAALGTSTMVGIFAVLQRLITFGITFLVSTNMIFAPLVADLTSRRDISEFARLYKLSTRWILTVSLPLFILMAYFGPELLSAFGEEFTSGYVPFLVLIVGGLINVATGSSVTLTMAGYPHNTAFNQALNLVMLVGLGVWLIPLYGLLGGVIAVTSGIALASILQVVQLWFHLRVHPYDRGFLKVLVAGSLLCLVLFIPRNMLSTTWPIDIFTILVALVIYFATLVALGLSPEEKVTIRYALQRFRVLAD